MGESGSAARCLPVGAAAGAASGVGTWSPYVIAHCVQVYDGCGNDRETAPT